MANEDVLSGFDPSHYPGKVCCGMMEHFVAHDYKFPFERPIGVSMEDMTLKALGWAVRFCKSKANGRIDQTKRGTVMVFIQFCPFCGKKLVARVPEKEE